MLRPDEASLDADNVMRIKTLFTENDYDYYFPEIGNNPPCYNAMLRAMSLFPAFCNEQVGGVQNTDDIDMTCKRELATLFAHISYTSGARNSSHDPSVSTLDFRIDFIDFLISSHSSLLSNSTSIPDKNQLDLLYFYSYYQHRLGHGIKVF